MPELSMVLDWAAAEGWNPGLDDAEPFHGADSEGFFLAEVDGDVAAAISVVNHTDDMAFLGLYICKPEYRGKGVGFALWQHAISHAAGRTIGLDGVPDQQANYARSGFVRNGETRRFEGIIDGEADASARVATAEDAADLDAREAKAAGYAKPRLNARWFQPGATRKTVITDGGFATVRVCRDGHKIGPLIAADVPCAARLIQHAAFETGGKIVIDVPDTMVDLAEWCSGQGMAVSFGTARMYRGTPPTAGGGIHTASTLELG